MSSEDGNCRFCGGQCSDGTECGINIMNNKDGDSPPTAALGKFDVDGELVGLGYREDGEDYFVWGTMAKENLPEKDELITRTDHEQDKAEALKRQRQEFEEQIRDKIEDFEKIEKKITHSVKLQGFREARRELEELLDEVNRE